MQSLSVAIKKTIPLLGAIFYLLTACNKSNYNNTSGSNGQAYVSVTNASPGTSAYDIFSDNTKVNTSGQLSYGSTTGSAGNPYLAFPIGTHSFRLSSNGTSFVSDTSVAFMANQHYSVFAYDTLQSGKLRTLILKDNLTVPISGQAGVRFLNLSSNVSSENALLIRGMDTIRINNLAFVGNTTTSIDSLAVFRTVNAGTYNIRVNSGENILWSRDSLTLASGKVYTIYSRGFMNGTGVDSLSTGVIQGN